jgi:hypothetical protein
VVGFFVYFCSFERGRKVCLPKYNMELVWFLRKKERVKHSNYLWVS